MKLMKFFLTAALALSTIAPSLSGMEAARHYVRQRSQDATQEELNNAESCNICHENFDPEYGALRVLRCSQDGIPHIFHRDCINNWLLSRQAAGHPAGCPICNTPAIPEASRKEQIIATLKNIEMQHNPFNMKNRLISLRALIATAIALTISKYILKPIVKADLLLLNRTTAKLAVSVARPKGRGFIEA